jgi:hypothetical protein
VPALRASVLSLTTLLFALLSPARLSAEGARVPVLLELFTSEGCSSCPPADDLLASLDKEQPLPGIEIIPLAWHVDYWDRLGWKDRFANPLYTARQVAYAHDKGWEQVYTPQAIVQGQDHAVGQDRPKILALAQAFSRMPAQRLYVDLRQDKLGRAQVHIQGALAGKPVTVALAEMGLVSDVKRGENAGSTLQHSAVVRLTAPVTARDKDGSLLWDASVKNLRLESKALRAVAWQETPGDKILAVGQSAEVFFR